MYAVVCVHHVGHHISLVQSRSPYGHGHGHGHGRIDMDIDKDIPCVSLGGPPEISRQASWVVPESDVVSTKQMCSSS